VAAYGHEADRGVSVRVLTGEAVEDIHRTRRLVECAVVRDLGEPPYALAGLAEAVTEGRRAAREGDWSGPGTAGIHFHRELVALAGSDRTDELMRGAFAELRPALHVVDGPRRPHEPYITCDQRILQTPQEASGRRRKGCSPSASTTCWRGSWRSTGGGPARTGSGDGPTAPGVTTYAPGGVCAVWVVVRPRT
jgi:hypothetical protein